MPLHPHQGSRVVRFSCVLHIILVVLAFSAPFGVTPCLLWGFCLRFALVYFPYHPGASPLLLRMIDNAIICISFEPHVYPEDPITASLFVPRLNNKKLKSPSVRRFDQVFPRMSACLWLLDGSYSTMSVPNCSVNRLKPTAPQAGVSIWHHSLVGWAFANPDVFSLLN